LVSFAGAPVGGASSFVSALAQLQLPILLRWKQSEAEASLFEGCQIVLEVRKPDESRKCGENEAQGCIRRPYLLVKNYRAGCATGDQLSQMMLEFGQIVLEE
jgi:hypothetical protein